MIETIGIVGAGTMGNGIAQVCAAAGLPVVMTDISDAALARGMSVVANSLERLVNKQKMTDADLRSGRLHRVFDLPGARSDHLQGEADVLRDRHVRV